MCSTTVTKLKYTSQEWQALSKEERNAVLAKRAEIGKAKIQAERQKESDDRFIREHPNALVNVISQEEADRRNAVQARMSERFGKLDKALGVVRKPVEPGIVRPEQLNQSFSEGPPYIRDQTGPERADENLTVAGIFGGSITSGASLGAFAGNVVPGLGNVVAGILGAYGGAIVGMAASYAYCKNEENRRRS